MGRCLKRTLEGRRNYCIWSGRLGEGFMYNGDMTPIELSLMTLLELALGGLLVFCLVRLTRYHQKFQAFYAAWLRREDAIHAQLADLDRDLRQMNTRLVLMEKMASWRYRPKSWKGRILVALSGALGKRISQRS